MTSRMVARTSIDRGACMPSSTPTAAEDQLRHARSVLEADLRAGEDRRAEDLFAQNPALATDTEAALELIYTEHVIREELGQAPTPEQWCARFPRWRGDLEQL